MTGFESDTDEDTGLLELELDSRAFLSTLGFLQVVMPGYRLAQLPHSGYFSSHCEKR